MPKLDIHANPTHFNEWSPGKIRSRWDYDCPDYTLENMVDAGDRFFATCTHMLRSGDLVYVTDANNVRATLVINLVDPVRHTVAWDIDVAHAEKPVIAAEQAYAIRWRGARGGRFAIIDRNNKVVARDMMSRDEAEARLALITEGAKAA